MRRVIALAITAATGLFGYTYDFTQSPVAADTTRWQANGSATFQSFGVTFGSGAGSLIYKPAISGTTPNDYELSTTWSIKSGGGTYVLYYRASSQNITGCTSGVSYRSFELSVPTVLTGPGRGRPVWPGTNAPQAR